MSFQQDRVWGSLNQVFVALHGRGWQVLLSPGSTGHHSGPSIVWRRVPKLTGGQTRQNDPKGCGNPGNPGTPSRSPCLWSPPSPVLPSLGRFFPKSFRWCDFPDPLNGPAQTNGPLRSRRKARGLAFRAIWLPSCAPALPPHSLPWLCGLFLMPGVPCLTPLSTGHSYWAPWP